MENFLRRQATSAVGRGVGSKFSVGYPTYFYKTEIEIHAVIFKSLLSSSPTHYP